MPRHLKLAWPLVGVKPFAPRNSFARRGYSRTEWNPEGLHLATDLAAKLGTILRALRPGKITFRGWSGDLGNVIAWYDSVLDCTWAYCHCQSFGVYRVGQTIAAGSKIARLGSTGRSSGPHVHVVRIAGDFRFNRDRWGSRPHLDPRDLILEAALRAS